MVFAGCGNPEPMLEAPHNVVASNRTYNDKVVVGWDAVTGATHYRLFRSPAPEGPYAQLGADVSAIAAEDTTGTAGVAYYYKVRACSSTNAEGAWSDYAAGEKGAFPNAPEHVSASAGTFTTKIAVQWSAVTGADHYLVYRSTSSSGAFAGPITSTPSTAWEDTTGDAANAATAGTHYFYKIKAVSAGGESAFSPSAEGYASAGTAIPELPCPKSVRASVRTSNSKIAVGWDPVAGAASYRVFRSLTPDGDYSPISGQVAAPATTFEDADAFEDTAYSYKVKAYGASSESTFSPSATGRRELTPFEYLLRFNLEWDRMYRKLSEQKDWPPSGETSYSFAGETHGSEKVSITVPWSLPLKAITSFSHTGYSDHGMTFEGTETLTVSATTTVKDQDGTCTGTVTTGGSYSGTVEDHLQIDGALRVPSNTSSFIVTYQGTKETIEFGQTRVSRGGLYHLILSSPHHVSASQGAARGAVNLAWAPVYGADKYQVFRSSAAGGPYALLGETTGSWISRDGTIYTYTDASVSPGVHYFYEVVAANTTVCNDLNANKIHDTSNPDETVYSEPSSAVEGWAL
jgi:fibronectin type 3 domain-containing protein